MDYTIEWFPLGDCKPIPAAIPAVKKQKTSLPEVTKKDKENTMNTDTTATARRALSNATFETYRKVDREALEKFGFMEARRPKNAAELIEWIKAGDYITPDTHDEDYDPADYQYEYLYGITFPPKVKKDRTGYDKHMVDFAKDKAAVELEINVLEPAEALKSYKRFESKWIH